MRLTAPRLMTAAASAVVAVGLVTSAVERSQALLGYSVAGLVGVAVGWVVLFHDDRSPVGPAVAWTVAAIAGVSLYGVLLGNFPWSTAMWPFNLAGVLALLLVFPDGARPGRPWSALPWAFLAAEARVADHPVGVNASERKSHWFAASDVAPWTSDTSL